MKKTYLHNLIYFHSSVHVYNLHKIQWRLAAKKPTRKSSTTFLSLEYATSTKKKSWALYTKKKPKIKLAAQKCIKLE